MTDEKEIKAIIESILFAHGDLLSVADIKKTLDNIQITTLELQNLINELIEEYKNAQRGIELIKIENSYKLLTKQKYHYYINKLKIESIENNISKAGLEALSIIAYEQPISRLEIENIRGVKSNQIVQTLLDKKLIEELGRLDKPGRPIIYGTTKEFLKIFGLEGLESLPKIDKKL